MRVFVFIYLFLVNCKVQATGVAFFSILGFSTLSSSFIIFYFYLIHQRDNNELEKAMKSHNENWSSDNLIGK